MALFGPGVQLVVKAKPTSAHISGSFMAIIPVPLKEEHGFPKRTAIPWQWRATKAVAAPRRGLDVCAKLYHAACNACIFGDSPWLPCFSCRLPFAA